MTKKEIMYQNIEKHGQNILKIFPNAKQKNPIKLSKQLRTLDLKMHKFSTYFCNGNIQIKEYSSVEEQTLKRLRIILNDSCYQCFVNSDPRGYALKISDTYIKNNNITIFTDMGGYGILAPDFSY